jgi:hypothetical protein
MPQLFLRRQDAPRIKTLSFPGTNPPNLEAIIARSSTAPASEPQFDVRVLPNWETKNMNSARCNTRKQARSRLGPDSAIKNEQQWVQCRRENIARAIPPALIYLFVYWPCSSKRERGVLTPYLTRVAPRGAFRRGRESENRTHTYTRSRPHLINNKMRH